MLPQAGSAGWLWPSIWERNQRKPSWEINRGTTTVPRLCCRRFGRPNRQKKESQRPNPIAKRLPFASSERSLSFPANQRFIGVEFDFVHFSRRLIAVCACIRAKKLILRNSTYSLRMLERICSESQIGRAHV